MKHNTFTLLKILFMNQFKLNQLKDKNQKARRNALLMGSIFLLLGVVLASYSFGIGYSLGIIGIAWVIPSYSISIVGLITLFFTIFKCNGILFGTKDYENLMSLPIKTSEIIESRFLHMYLMNTCFAFLVMVPLGIVYYYFERPTSSFIFFWIVGILFSTLLPTTLATIIGGLIAYFASHFKYTNAVSTILSLALVIGIIISSMGLGGVDESALQISQLINLGEIISKQLHSIYPLSNLYEKAILDSNVGALLIFIVISLIVYLLLIKILSIKYMKINTAILSYQTSSNYKI